MSTSGDRTTRIKFQISERNQPIPCCSSDGCYLLTVNDTPGSFTNTTTIIDEVSFAPNSAVGNIAFAASADVLYTGESTADIYMTVSYTTDTSPSPIQFTSATFTLTSGNPAQISIITDDITYTIIENYSFIVTLTTSAETSFTGGKLLITAGAQ